MSAPLVPRTPEEFARALHRAFRRGFAFGKDDAPPYHGMSLTERTDEAFVEQYPDLSFAADGQPAPEFDWEGIWDAVNPAPAKSASEEEELDEEARRALARETFADECYHIAAEADECYHIAAEMGS